MTRPAPRLIAAIALLLALALITCGDDVTSDPSAPPPLPTSPPESAGWFCVVAPEATGRDARPTPVCRPLPPTPEVTPEVIP